MPSDVVYISVDIESDGPVPGLNSMLSLGAAAFVYSSSTIRDSDASACLLKGGSFSTNIVELPGASPSPTTMREFWDKNPVAWAECHKNRATPREAAVSFLVWCDSVQKATKRKPKLVAWPAAFDVSFINYYCRLVLPDGKLPPFGFDAIDIRSVIYGSRFPDAWYTDCVKARLPPEYFRGIKKAHNHIAVDDAVEQGIILMNALFLKEKEYEAKNH
jgi:hypothetical protein